MHTQAGQRGRKALWLVCVLAVGVATANRGLAAGKSRSRKEAARAMARTERAIAKMRRSKRPSRSLGTFRDGRLVNALELPVTDLFGYRVRYPKRQTHYGADRMVFGLMTLGVRMRLLCGEAGQFDVGDISAKEGGKLSPHITHQMGLDVDLGLYVTDPKGKPLSNRMVTFDEKGWSKDKSLRFDVRRNWWLVASMIENRHFAKIRCILLADWLKKLLLDYAERRLRTLSNPDSIKRQKDLIRQAEKLVRQPKSSPHANHYHVSLKQTDD